MWFWIFIALGIIVGFIAGEWWAGTVIGGIVGVVVQICVTNSKNRKKKARQGRRRPHHPY